MSDVWKQLTVTLIAILMTGVTAWFSFGGGVSRAEGQTLQAKDAELERRQAVLEERLLAQRAVLDELKVEVRSGNAETQRKLDSIIGSLPGDRDARVRRPTN